MTEISEDIKEEIIFKALKAGYKREVQVTRRSFDPAKERANLRRLVELCLENSGQDFTDEILYELEPEFIVPSQYGDLYIGGRGDQWPHCSWKNFNKLISSVGEEEAQKTLNATIKFEGKFTTNSSCVQQTDVLSCLLDMYNMREKYLGI